MRPIGLMLVAAVAIFVPGCGVSAPAMAQLDEGDMVYSGIGPVEAKNVERFEAFIAVTESGGNDAIRIVSVTIEGDPIYTDLSYTDGKYTIYYDASEDAFASADDRKRKKVAECEKLKQADRADEYIEYSCSSFKFMIRDF